MSQDLGALAAALPGYEVGGELGRGGWGVVIEGTHRQLGRKVAIKQLPRAFAADEAVRARFVAEARLLAALDHPHIVPVFDYVETDGLCLLVMEHLPGGSVWDRFSSAGLAPEGACAVILATCTGLQFAHQNGVLHRDIKPENLIFNAAGVLKVTDFGIAKVMGGTNALATRAGEVLGTPAYMAPEQATGGELGPPTDVYAAGTMLYELLSGRLPFPEEGDALALLFRHVHEPPTPLRQVAPQVGEPLAEATMRALATSRSERFATAEEFGVAVAEAAAATWGPGWLERADLQILGGGPIVAAIERPTVPAAASATPATVRADAVPSAPVAPARATATVRGVGVSALEVDRADIVPVKKVVEVRPPWIPLASALALLAAAAGLALAGIGAPARSGDLAPGTVTVAGADPAGREAIPLDLTKPIPVVAGRLPPGAEGTTQVSLTLSVLGVRLASGQAEPAVSSGGGLAASIDAASGRFLVAGETTGEIRFLGPKVVAPPGGGEPQVGQSVLAGQRFSATSQQPLYLTLPAAAAAGLLLFVLAYVESLLRPLRRGRRRVTGVAGMAVMGTLAGVVIVAAAWLIGGREPTLPTVVAAAAAGGVAGVSLAVAAIRIGRRRRLRGKKNPN